MKHKQQGCFRGTDCDDCYGCHLAICIRCKGAEGSLTTECSGMPLDFDSEQEIYKEGLDFTRELGWHKMENYPGPLYRTPQFED